MEADNDSRSRRQLLTEIALISLLVLLPIFVWIGRGDVENDEAIYSFASDRIVETGEWLTPVAIYEGNPPFLEKPPLKLWLVAFGLKLGLPDSNWGHRFFDAVFSAAAFFYLVGIGYRMGGRWAGLFSGLIFFTFREPMLDHGLLSNNMESALVLQYAGSLFHFQSWMAADRGSTANPIAIALLFVLGFMTKFVAALFLPLVLVGVLLLHPRLLRRFLSEWSLWLAAAGLAAVLIAPWFLYQSANLGQAFWDDIFGQHIVRRFVEYLHEGHVKPWYFYWVATLRILLVSGALIGFLFVPLMILRTFGRGRDPAMTSIVLWYLLPIAAMSVMTSKVTHYAYPFLPPIAVLGGIGTARLLTLAPGSLRAFYPWALVRTIIDRIGWLRFHRVLQVLSILPIVVAYGVLIYALATRPSTFTTLKACLRKMEFEPRVKVAIDRGRVAHHAFAFYDVATFVDLDDNRLNLMVFGDGPEPVWLTRSRYRERMEADPGRWRSLDALILPPAHFIEDNGQIDRGVLLLPGEYSNCSKVLENAGAWSATP